MTKATKAKLKLPKKIAGIKIPKQLRKPSGSPLAFLETAEGREIAAGALVAIAEALTGGGRIKKAAAEDGLKHLRPEQQAVRLRETLSKPQPVQSPTLLGMDFRRWPEDRRRRGQVEVAKVHWRRRR